MKASRLGKVKREAERLLGAIYELEAGGAIAGCPADPDRAYSGGRLTGAVRRASLELTRALADLRRR